MESIKDLFTIDYSSFFITGISFLIGLKAVTSVLEWLFIEKLKIETAWTRKKKEEHNLLIQTSKGLIELEKKYDKNNTEIRQDIKYLTDMFVQKEIDDMRWEIINFATDLSSGKTYNRESFDHILRIYQKYEDILNKKHMENGLVTESIEYINEMYRENLKHGVV